MASLQCKKPTEQIQPQANGESTKSSAAHKITEMAIHVMKGDQKNQEQSYKEVANHEQVVAHENQVVECECKSHESVVAQDGKIKTATNEKKHKKKKKKKDEKQTKEANKDCHKVTYDTSNAVICKSIKADKKTKDEKKKEQKEKKKKKKSKDKDGKSSSSSSSSSSESEDDACNKKKGGKK